MTDSRLSVDPAGKSSISFHMSPASEEVIRIDAEGFHYRGQFIEDAGEAHRLLLEFLYKQQPKPASVCNGLEEFCVNWWGSDTDEPTVTEAIEKGTMASFAEAVLARWGNHPGSPDSSTQPS